MHGIVLTRTYHHTFMKRREASFQTLFNKYLRVKRLYGNFELKQTKGVSISFSCLEEHQIAGLLAGEREGLVWKYSDQDQRQKPFDCSSNPPLPGFVVVRFSTHFYVIPIRAFLDEMVNRARKSLTQQRARDICLHAVRLSP